MYQENISGEILSRLLETLTNANSENMDIEELKQKVMSIFTLSENVYSTTEPAKTKGNFNYSNLNTARLETLSSNSLEKLNTLLPWCSVSEVGVEKYLGTAWSNRKRASVATFPDPLVNKLNSKISLKNFNILEVGCFEGHHTASLGVFSKSVVAFDGRLENVIKTLVHCWLMGIDQQVRVECIDIEKYNIYETFLNLGITKKFDLIHHRGVLYHISDPCKHLSDLAKLTDKHIYLHTQVATSEQAQDKYQTEFGEITAFFYREPKVGFSPFSGLTTQAVWLTKKNLCEFLNLLGFRTIDILDERLERNGMRLELLASR
jgi:hypothetical protein